jgi:hypothetical protein
MQITTSAMRQYGWVLRSIAAATALIILLWVGAISPHLVHHLFDEDQAQFCLMSAQAGHFPWLIGMQPSLALLNTLQLGFPVLPVWFPPKPYTISSLSRAPPFLRM